ncbi:MAG: flippase-like domain-containing protein [Tetrasphaera sp.]
MVAIASGPPIRDGLARHRRALVRTAQVGLVAAIGWFLVRPQLAAVDLASLRAADRGWLALAALAAGLSMLSLTLLTVRLLPPVGRPAWSRVARSDVSALALGRSVPNGGAVGIAVNLRLLADQGVTVRDATVSKLAQGIGSGMVLHLLILLGLAGSALAGAWAPWGWLPLVTSAAFLGFGAVVLTAAGRPRMWAVLGSGLSRMPRVGTRLGAAVAGVGQAEAIGHLRASTATPRRAAPMLGCSIGIWVGDALALWAALRAFGVHAGLLALLVAYAAQSVSGWVPITPGGVGIAEVMMIPALVALGGAEPAVAGGIVAWRVVAYWLPIPLGVLAYASLTWRRPRH